MKSHWVFFDRCHLAGWSPSLCLIPVHHVPPIAFLSLFCLLFFCPYWCESLFFCLCCLCPAIRIHNHTVLPSSHNSSYVYNDSAYTNISAILGEDPSLFLSLKIICASPTAFCCSLCIATRLSWALHIFLPVQSSVLADWNEDFLVCWW